MTVFDILKIKWNTKDPKLIKRCDEVLEKWHKRMKGENNDKQIKNS